MFKTIIIAILISLTFINKEPVAHADQDAKWEKIKLPWNMGLTF